MIRSESNTQSPLELACQWPSQTTGTPSLNSSGGLPWCTTLTRWMPSVTSKATPSFVGCWEPFTTAPMRRNRCVPCSDRVFTASDVVRKYTMLLDRPPTRRKTTAPAQSPPATMYRSRLGFGRGRGWTGVSSVTAIRTGPLRQGAGAVGRGAIGPTTGRRSRRWRRWSAPTLPGHSRRRSRSHLHGRRRHVGLGPPFGDGHVERPGFDGLLQHRQPVAPLQQVEVEAGEGEDARQ